MERAGITRHFVRRTYRRVFHKPARVPLESVAEAARILRTPNALYTCHAAARAIPFHHWEQATARLAHIQLPTLIIWGERDPVVPLANGYRFVRDIPQAQLRRVGSCGHTPQLEAPRLVGRLIGNWIEDELRGSVRITRAPNR